MIACITTAINSINSFAANLIGEPHLMTSTWTILLLGLGFAVFESFWRRWFGGGFDYKWLKWLNFRFIKHVINIVAIFAVCYWTRGLSFMWAIYFAAILDGVFWTPTFGMYMDIGRSPWVTPEDEKEYNEQFCAKFLNWLFDKKYWYGIFYDYMGMTLRFGIPCLLMFFVPTFNSGLILIGIWTAMAYGLGWTMQERGCLKRVYATEFAEFASGAFVGWMTAVCGLI